MVTVKDIITAFDDAPDTTTRGTAFERMMLHFFTQHPALSRTYSEVHRWSDWTCNGGRPDTGIDLVAKHADGSGWAAIQCKFYSPTTTLQKPDIDSFLATSGKTFTAEDGSPAVFVNRIIVSTTDRWGANARAAIEDQSIPVQVIGVAQIADAGLEWDFVASGDNSVPEVTMSPRPIFEPRPHQREAIDAVLEGFRDQDRGRLIMACGTGKTFTALRLAERMAQERGDRARVLFCVPSLALLGQTLREWTANATMEMRFIAVGSDTKIGRAAEDIAAHDLEVPVTTDGAAVAAKLAEGRRARGLRVVFSTYHSIGAIHEAQKRGADPFDLVICDEAHRTTGVTAAGAESSAFVKVHDSDYVKADKRLYMTATPRLYDDSVKDRAAEVSAELVSMDDEDVYGPELHRLGFGEAVEKGLLTDYKVMVLAVDEAVAADAAVGAAPGGELPLDVTSKIIGCWNGLARRTLAASVADVGDGGAADAGREADVAGAADDGWDGDGDEGIAAGAPAPLQRAVAFAQDIKASKAVAASFPLVVDAFTAALGARADQGDRVDETNLDLRVVADHVDGSMNALQRDGKLSWLKAPVPDNECRVLSNARCLAEGVDVPALDGVVFFHPRNSVVDVVQSVGRVMRRSPGKDYGYIILPVAVPSSADPAVALANNDRFRVVWQVLNALRSHDDRFNAVINSAQINAGDGAGDGGQGALVEELAKKIEVDYIDVPGVPGDAPEPGTGRHGAGEMAEQLALASLDEWRQAIYTRIVDRVGQRKYWEDWAKDIADIAAAQIARINARLVGADEELEREFDRFLTGLRGNLNEAITAEEAVSMLSQHLITAPVFDALFAEHDFASHNPVSQVMERMVGALGDGGLNAETRKLESFYDSVRVRAAQVTTLAAKQTVIKDLYEKFFRAAFRRQAEALGIVYTPVEIVDFILRAADEVSREHFGRGLTDEGVHVLDPFTGTGTFLVRLLQSGIIEPEDLARKYACELHASEIMLLAYYIACVNIETTYHALAGAKAYEPFAGAVLADTFQTTEEGDALDFEVFRTNNERITRQLATPIHVIVGNPPYSVGQKSANDNNQNLKYPTLDARIEETYAAKSTAQLKNSLYDSYLRAYRWATDRIGDRGIVAFVSNGGWLDGNTADGVRLSMAEDFDEILIYNLRGNQRTAGELSRKEGGKVFGSGSRNTVAVVIGVKTGLPDRAAEPARIRYYAVDDYLTAEQKLDGIDHASVATVPWQEVTPNAYGDWLNQRSDTFGTWPVLSDKKNTDATQVFDVHSLGLATARDAWCYASSRRQLDAQVDRMTATYAGALDEFSRWCDDNGIRAPKTGDVDVFLRERPHLTARGSISWTDILRKYMVRRHDIPAERSRVFPAMYRPWFRQHVQFQRELNHRVYQLPRIFPTAEHDNVGFYIVNPGSSKPFSALATTVVPDLAFWGSNAGQFFPRWTWEPVEAPEGELDFAGAAAGGAAPGAEGEIVEGYRRVDNITDAILAEYRRALGGDVAKDDIFHFVYAQLHDPGYRETYAADLKKMLPHIETPTDRDRFDRLVAAGRDLMALHVGYEDVEPYPLDVQLKPGALPGDRETWRVTKMKWARVRGADGKLRDDRTRIIYNPEVTISGIPAEAERYQLGSRSALAWILDRYQVRTDKKSGIVNDPNDWCDEVGNPRYIVDLIGKVTRVAVETNRIVDSIATTGDD